MYPATPALALPLRRSGIEDHGDAAVNCTSGSSTDAFNTAHAAMVFLPFRAHIFCDDHNAIFFAHAADLVTSTPYSLLPSTLSSSLTFRMYADDLFIAAVCDGSPVALLSLRR